MSGLYAPWKKRRKMNKIKIIFRVVFHCDLFNEN